MQAHLTATKTALTLWLQRSCGSTPVRALRQCTPTLGGSAHPT